MRNFANLDHFVAAAVAVEFISAKQAGCCCKEEGQYHVIDRTRLKVWQQLLTVKLQSCENYYLPELGEQFLQFI